MESMITDRIASPEFAVVVRGYDRAQVDEYLGELLGWLSEAERRILATDEANESLRREVVQLRTTAASLEERAGVPGPQSLSAFGERMGQVMQSAVAAAEELRAQAEREANERRDAVAAEVERMVERAKAEAREILRRGRAKERDLEENVAALGARRAAAVEELSRLHNQLSELLSMPEAANRNNGRQPVEDPAALANPARTRTGDSNSGALVEPASAPGPVASLPEPGAGGHRAAPATSGGHEPATITQTLPAVERGSTGTPEPTEVQRREPGGSGRRGPH
jgi:DivIVA domain-containing protein